MSDNPPPPTREDYIGPNARNPFGNELATRPVGAIANAEQQKSIAEVQARMIIARANPRDPIRCMDLILRDCTRPTLAEKALYQYARGGSSISGPSIRLAEAIAQRWGNIASGIKEMSRSNGYSECVAYAWDLESGYYDERQYQVRHWRDTKQGGYALTDERDIYELIANMGQRRKRAVLLTVIPGDVVEAAQDQCDQTLHVTADTSPEALAKIAAAFEQFGIVRTQIEKRCQCRLEAIRPAQVVQLRKIYASIKDGMSDAADWFDAPNGAWAATDRAHEANKPPQTTRQQSSQTGAAASAGAEGGPVQGHGQTVLGQTGGGTPPTNTERDSAGVAWNERLHASSKARNTDGTWRARRGADKEAASEQRQDEPTSGGLFGDETQQQNSPAQPGPQSGTASAAAVSDEPRSGGEAEASAGHLAPFEAWLVDGEGNPIADADGVIEAIRDPVTFARTYMEALSNEFPGTIDLFKVANKEALVAATIASTEVAPILAGAVKDAGGAGLAIDPAFVPPPTKSTKAEFESYLARLKTVASAWTTDAAITHGVAVNTPIYEAPDFPAPYRMKAKGIIADRREAVKPAPARGAAEPTLNDIAASMTEDLKSFDKATDIEAWKSFGKIATELTRLKDGAPDLYDRVTRFAERRRLELLAAQMTAKVRATTTLAACDGITTDKWCIATYLDLQKNADDLAQQVKMDSRAHRATLEEGQTATG